MKAIIFGSLNALCDLSTVECDAFNAAFAQQGLPWVWDAATYREMSCRLTEAYEPSSPEHATSRDVDFDGLLALKDKILFEMIEKMRFQENREIIAALDFGRRKRIHRALISQQSRLIVNSVRAALPGVVARDLVAAVCRGDADRAPTRQGVYGAIASKVHTGLERCVSIETTHRGIDTALSAGVGKVLAYRIEARPHQKARGAIDVTNGLEATLKSLHWQWKIPKGLVAPASNTRLTATPPPLIAQSA